MDLYLVFFMFDLGCHVLRYLGKRIQGDGVLLPRLPTLWAIFVKSGPVARCQRGCRLYRKCDNLLRARLLSTFSVVIVVILCYVTVCVIYVMLCSSYCSYVMLGSSSI